jgi:hypothetical protein
MQHWVRAAAGLLPASRALGDERVRFDLDELALVRDWFDRNAAFSPWAGFATLGGQHAVALFSRAPADGCMIVAKHADGTFSISLRGGRVVAREARLSKVLTLLAPEVTCH